MSTTWASLFERIASAERRHDRRVRIETREAAAMKKRILEQDEELKKVKSQAAEFEAWANGEFLEIRLAARAFIAASLDLYLAYQRQPRWWRRAEVHAARAERERARGAHVEAHRQLQQAISTGTETS